MRYMLSSCSVDNYSYKDISRVRMKVFDLLNMKVKKTNELAFTGDAQDALMTEYCRCVNECNIHYQEKQWEERGVLNERVEKYRTRPYPQAALLDRTYRDFS